MQGVRPPELKWVRSAAEFGPQGAAWNVFNERLALMTTIIVKETLNEAAEILLVRGTTTIRTATGADLSAIESLRRHDGDALGFVPKAKYEHIVYKTDDRGRSRWKYEWLIVAEDNGEVTGFLLTGFHRDGCKMQQLCVRHDARRMERALAIVDACEVEARKRGCLRIRCRVAADIDANFFWQAAGYRPIAKTKSTWLNVKESASQRPLFIYDKALDQGSLFDLTVGSLTVPDVSELAIIAFSNPDDPVAGL